MDCLLYLAQGTPDRRALASPVRAYMCGRKRANKVMLALPGGHSWAFHPGALLWKICSTVLSKSALGQADSHITVH